MKNDINEELPTGGKLGDEQGESTLPLPTDAENTSADAIDAGDAPAVDLFAEDGEEAGDIGECEEGTPDTDDAKAPDDGELDWQPTGIEYSELDYSDMPKNEESEHEDAGGDADAPECDGDETDGEDAGGEIAAEDTVEEPDDEAVTEDTDEDEEDDDNEIDDGLPIPPEEVERPRRERQKREIGTRRIDTLFDFLELFIFTFVAVLIATSFLFRHSVVSGDSMMNTLQNADKLIISNLFYEPCYMDIVVVQDYSAGIDEPIVKRVIATEGQLVRVAPEGIYVDGEFLDEDGYVYIDAPNIYYYSVDPSAFLDNETLRVALGQYYEFTVPEDEVFILGDHRNNSRDSRYYGTVREDAILGRVMLRFYPFDSFTFFKRGGDENGN